MDVSISGGCLDGCNSRSGPLRIPTGSNQRESLRCQCVSDRQADAAGRPRDQANPAAVYLTVLADVTKFDAQRTKFAVKMGTLHTDPLGQTPNLAVA